MTRQESLFAILPRAVEAAKEGKVQVTVANDSRYAQDGGRHVYCPTEAFPILYPYSSNFEAVVEKDGSVFFTKIEDVLEALHRHFAPKVKATICNSDGTDGPVLICPPDKPTWDKIEGGGEQ